MTETEEQEEVTINGVDYIVLVNTTATELGDVVSYCHLEHMGERLNASIEAIEHDGGWERDDGSLVPCDNKTLKALCDVAEGMGYS